MVVIVEEKEAFGGLFCWTRFKYSTLQWSRQLGKAKAYKMQVPRQRGEAEILGIPIDSPPSLHLCIQPLPNGKRSNALECG